MSMQSSDLIKNVQQYQPNTLTGYGFSTIVIHSGQEPEQWESRSMIPPIVSSTIFKRRGRRGAFSGTTEEWSGIGQPTTTTTTTTPRWGTTEYGTDRRTTSGFGYYGVPESEYNERICRSGYGFDTTTFRDTTTTMNLPYLPGKLEYGYGRNTNPTRTALEKCLTSLENAKYAVALSSGTAALTVLTSLLDSGSHCLLIDEAYVDTKRFFRDCAKRMGIESSFVDMLDIEETTRSVLPNTRMVWIETPTNPSLKIVDIKRIVDAIKRKQPNCIVVVDNTLATPLFQRPLDLGADVVIHSLSKYLNGHMDVVMGALMTNDEQMFRKIKILQDILGVTPSPFDCHQVNRGLKTFPLRMREHMSNAYRLANVLQEHPLITQVIYPGLRSHPQYDLFKKQMKGFGGVVCIRIKGGAREIEKFIDSLKVISCAESLGGYASLIEQPDREFVERGLDPSYGENFLRISVGIEDVDDLISDIHQALNKMNI